MARANGGWLAQSHGTMFAKEILKILLLQGQSENVSRVTESRKRILVTRLFV